MKNAVATIHTYARDVKWSRFFLTALAVVIASTAAIYAEGDAAGASVPWEGALEGILNILTGRTARFIAALMFVGGAMLWGFSRNEDGMSTIGKVILSVGLIIGSLSITDLIFTAVV
jgi:type IV secretory pathway VirB2 component (pilin)